MAGNLIFLTCKECVFPEPIFITWTWCKKTGVMFANGKCHDNYCTNSSEYHVAQFKTEVTDGQVVQSRHLSASSQASSGGHELEPLSGRTWSAWYFCRMSYLNQLCFQNRNIKIHSKKKL